VKCKDDNKLEQIFEATIKLVAKEGLAGLTMNKIAQEAGIGTGTLYVYFKGKEELINALFLRVKTRSARCYLRNYDETEPFKVGFRKIWTNILEDKLHEHELSVFVEQCVLSPYLDECIRAEMGKVTAPFFAMMERGKKEHLVKEMDTMLLLSSVMGVIVEFVHMVKVGMVQPTKENIDACFTISWDAIKQ
jgi:AcrR family transcriptional regulator